MTMYDATELSYKNGYENGKAAVLKDLMEVYNDLDKICDAAGEGKVEVWHDNNGETVETQPYEMTGNAFADVCGLWQNIRMIFVKNGIQLP